MGELQFIISLETWQAFVALVGPLIVAIVTGLNTTTKVKTIISIAVVVVLGSIEAILAGAVTADVFGTIVAVAVIWQSMYNFLWKNLGVTHFLQKKVPIRLFDKSE